MLPSQGLFRSLPCPFFVAGLCERPHCTFRHCKSDIRIDRKLDADLADEPIASTSADTPQSSDNEVQMSQSSIDSSQTLSKAPASSSQPERLNSSPSTNQRKRSKDSESTTGNAQEEEQVVKVLTSDKKTDHPSSNKTKRRRVISVSSEKGGGGGGEAADSSVQDIMGEIASKVKNIQVVSATNSPAAPSITSSGKSRKSKREQEDDIDKLVEEIEKSGKSSSSSTSGKKSSHHSSSSHKQRKDEQSSSKMSSCSGSHRKENSSGHHHRSSHKKESPSKKKEDERNRKSSRKESGDRDSAASGSISSSKDSSERKGTKSSSSSHHHSSSKTDKKRDKEKDKHDKGGSCDKDKVDKRNVSLKKERSVDTMNRFTALQTESSPDDEQEDESAYNSDVFDDSFDNFNYPPDSDEDDPEMVARECLEMFENYRPPPKEEEVEGKKGKEEEGGGDLDEGFCVVGGAGKKRVAHGGGVVPTLRAPVVIRQQPPATSRNLQGQLLKRFEDQSSSSSSLACVKQVVKLDERINGSPGPNFPKLPAPGAPPVMKMRRIAHVPNAGALSQKPVIGGGGGAKSPIGQGQPLTYSQTAAKGVKREAHKPSAVVVQKKGPIIFRDAINKSTKIPHATRQQIMDKMFAEYCRLNDDHDKAFEMTVMREHELIQKCSSKQVYYSSGISIISGMRKMSKEEDGGVGGLMVGGNRVVSHEMILSGGGLAARNCSVRTVRREGGGLPVGNGLYKSLRRYVMTEVQLVENGYPRPHPSGEPGRALAKPRMGEEGEVLSLTDRKCDRCKKRYFTREDGEHLVREVCNYHWGRKYNMAARGGRGARESTYVCCGSDDDKMGCATSVCHVSKCPVPISNQKGFVEAVLEEGEEERMGEDPWDIIGIDCEMVYTTHGNELARVTVVGADRKVLYDEVVKPTHKVLDCNTRFSGITFDDLDKAKRTITEVQAILLMHLRPNTILIGHSLESDLIALRLKHECVIDTTILYPHKMGPPKKRALKTLSVEILKKVIQESDGGHDSAEDAQIAVELVMAKLKFDTTK